MSSFPYIPPNNSDQGPSYKDQVQDTTVEDATAPRNQTPAPDPPVGSVGLNPAFKGQLRQVSQVPIAEATPVSPYKVENESNDTENQRKLLELEEQCLRLERERLALQQQQQQQQPSQESKSAPSASGFNKRKWAIVGAFSFLAVLLTSLAIALAARNKSSSDFSLIEPANSMPTPQPVMAPAFQPVVPPTVTRRPVVAPTGRPVVSPTSRPVVAPLPPIPAPTPSFVSVNNTTFAVNETIRVTFEYGTGVEAERSDWVGLYWANATILCWPCDQIDRRWKYTCGSSSNLCRQNTESFVADAPGKYRAHLLRTDGSPYTSLAESGVFQVLAV